MPEWSATTLLREVRSDVWEMRHPATPYKPFGTIERIEVGPYRETWFHAITAAGVDLGVPHEVEQMAHELYTWGQPAAAHEKPFPGYPSRAPSMR